jgi:hypothetical protein
LPGWRIDAHDRVGRPTSEGASGCGAGRQLAPVVVVSLGTNDPDGSEDEFRAPVDDASEVVGRDRCVLWATIVRDGTARTGSSPSSREAWSAHPNLRLVDWARMVATTARSSPPTTSTARPMDTPSVEETARAARLPGQTMTTRGSCLLTAPRRA